LDLRLGYFTDLTSEFDELLEESLKEEHQFLKRLKENWLSGENRFDKAGETHVVAVEGAKAVGICGLNIDPYLDDPTIGRVRHLYVHPEFRRLTIGSILVEEVIEEAKEHFKVLRLRTHDEGAAAFYMKHGFKESILDNETHRLEF
jgi:ribosomal protein S18 acetylase RimI-like enzyme